MFKYIGLFVLVIGMLSASCASNNLSSNSNTDNSNRAVAASNDKVRNLINSLNGTQWTGTAKALNLPSYFKKYSIKRIATRIILGKDFGSDDANMAFQVHDGRLFYLSKIFASDKLVEKRGMGLCDFSPPREAVFREDASGNIVGDIVLPERTRDEDSGVLSAVSYYKSPLLSVGLSENNTKLNFVAQPFVGVDKFRERRREIQVTYDMSNTPSELTSALADELSHCLEHKPWLNKK